VLFFSAGEAEDEAEVELFFLVVEVELFLVPLVVEAEDVVIEASSFFCVWQPRKAVNVSAVIKDKTGVFIVWLSLTKARMSIPPAQGKP